MAKKKAADAQTWRGSEDLRPLLVPIGDLSLDPANVRKHGERNREAIRASLMRFGQQRPIVIDRRNVVRAGNGTLGEARELGWSHVAVTRSDLDSADLVGYAVADNRTASLAEWDDEALTATLKALADDGFDLDATGFNSAELDELIGSLGVDMGGDGEGTGEDPGAQTDRAAELQEKWQTASGQLWTVPSKATPGKAHRLLCGDSTKAEDVARLMGGEKADLCFTSPPYGQQRDYANGGIADWDALMQGVFANLPMSDAGQVLVNLGLIHREGEWVPYWDGWIAWMREHGWRRFGWYVWDKTHGQPGDYGGRFAPAHEFVFHFNRASAELRKCVEKKAENVKLGGGTGTRNKDGSMKGYRSNPEASLNTHKIPDSVIRVCQQMGGIEGHPAPFPVALASVFYESWPGLAYEPFTGSGTTIVAAEQTGRICYGLELAPRYCAVILERLSGLGLEPGLSV